jgi:hypothetical protein
MKTDKLILADFLYVHEVVIMTSVDYQACPLYVLEALMVHLLKWNFRAYPVCKVKFTV